MLGDPLRGEIWLIDLGQPIGNEAGYRRPGVVMTGNPHNSHSFVTVCACTSSRRNYVTHVELDADIYRLPATTYVQVEQLHTVSTERLMRRLGQVNPGDMAQIELIFRRHFLI